MWNNNFWNVSKIYSSKGKRKRDGVLFLIFDWCTLGVNNTGDNRFIAKRKNLKLTFKKKLNQTLGNEDKTFFLLNENCSSYFSRTIHAGRKNFRLDFRLVLRFSFAKNLATVQLRDKRIKIYALNSSRTRLQPDSWRSISMIIFLNNINLYTKRKLSNHR